MQLIHFRSLGPKGVLRPLAPLNCLQLLLILFSVSKFTSTPLNSLQLHPGNTLAPLLPPKSSIAILEQSIYLCLGGRMIYDCSYTPDGTTLEYRLKCNKGFRKEGDIFTIQFIHFCPLAPNDVLRPLTSLNPLQLLQIIFSSSKFPSTPQNSLHLL